MKYDTDARNCKGFDDRLSISRRNTVRHAYSQEADWRDVFGPSVPLYCFVSSEPCMDAPLYVPAGSSRSGTSLGRTALRSEGVYE